MDGQVLQVNQRYKLLACLQPKVCLIISGTTSACKGGSPPLVPAKVDHHQKCLQVASTTWHQHFLALEDPERREELLLHSRHAQVGVVVLIIILMAMEWFQWIAMFWCPR